MNEQLEITPQELINALIEQRNAALNELARATAALRTLQQKERDGLAGGIPAEAD